MLFWKISTWLSLGASARWPGARTVPVRSGEEEYKCFQDFQRLPRCPAAASRDGSRSGRANARMRPCFFATLAALALTATAGEPARQLKLLTPAGYLPQLPVLVRIEVTDDAGRRDWNLWDAEAILSTDAPGFTLSTNRVVLRNGLGSALVGFSGNGDFQLTATLGALQTNRVLQTLADQPVTTAGGVLAGPATTWSGIVLVTNDVIVPIGHTLTLQSNTLVLLSGVTNGFVATDLAISGTILSLGTEEHPVTITCAEADPRFRWGQIRHHSAQPSLYRHTTITRGGRSTGEGHTGTAPVLRPSGSKITFASCNITDHAETAVARTNSAYGTPGKVAFANGSNYERWLPKGEGRDYELNETFLPMKGLKDKFQVITNLAHDAANNWGDGPGDHARSGASFLTGCHAWKTLGSRLHLGISVDQIAARQVGHLTRLDSLQLGVEGARMYGSCDTGYPCAYQYNISWASETLPLAPEPNPRTVFEKLFGGGNAAERASNLRQRLARRKSVLDFVLEDVRSLNRDLGRNDRQKLDEYLAGIRKIETQIEKAERFRLPEPALGEPAGVPEGHLEHVDLMYDLMALAFQTDSTRVASFAVAPQSQDCPISLHGILDLLTPPHTSFILRFYRLCYGLVLAVRSVQMDKNLDGPVV